MAKTNREEAMYQMLIRPTTPKYEAIAAGEALLKQLLPESSKRSEVKQHLQSWQLKGTPHASAQKTKATSSRFSAPPPPPPIKKWPDDFARPATREDYRAFLKVRAEAIRAGKGLSPSGQAFVSIPMNQTYQEHAGHKKRWVCTSKNLHVSKDVGDHIIIMTHPQAEITMDPDVITGNIQILFMKNGYCHYASNLRHKKNEAFNPGIVLEYNDASILSLRMNKILRLISIMGVKSKIPSFRHLFFEHSQDVIEYDRLPPHVKLWHKLASTFQK